MVAETDFVESLPKQHFAFHHQAVMVCVFGLVSFCSYILLCLAVTLYFLLTCVPGGLLPSCVPVPPPPFGDFTLYISSLNVSQEA